MSNSAASKRALEAARQAWNPDAEVPSERQVRRVLAAAHDPALGEARSVRLGAVLDALRGGTITWHPDVRGGRRVPFVAADEFVAREFGNG